MKIRSAIAILMAFILFISCSKGNSGADPVVIDCATAASGFSANVSPIVLNNCAVNSGCHGGGSTNGPGQLITYSQIFNARAEIRPAVISRQMPKDHKLSNADINSIVCWIDAGAQNN